MKRKKNKETIKLSPSRPELRLDLACGAKPENGFVGVDLYAPGMQQVDLTKFPWPWADNSVLEIRCSHFVEHLPMVYVMPDGSYDVMAASGGVDLFIRFFNEVWRVLAPGGSALVIVPAVQSNRAFQDPTHRRFLTMESFFYLNGQFREINGLAHYLGATCAFDLDVKGSFDPKDPKIAGRTPEVQNEHMRTLRNVLMDWHATLVKPDKPAG
jgi:hypothetical protein